MAADVVMQPVHLPRACCVAHVIALLVQLLFISDDAVANEFFAFGVA